MSEARRGVEVIAEMAGVGLRSARAGTREFPVRQLPFLAVYRDGAAEVSVLTIFHTSRDRRMK
ncbi:MAG: hypothetical protein H0W36_15880 [Gemmatimonadetes bacterium]|nr:hypothetical protein [Gemmatimonadota bacterium]